MKPSPLQKAFLQWLVHGSGHGILEANAGCGKTSTIMQGVYYLFKHNPNYSIVVCAFAKDIQRELDKKVEKLKTTMNISWKNVEASTMHSLGRKLWVKVAPNVKVDENKVSNIIDAYFKETFEDIWKSCADQIKRLVALGKNSAIGAAYELDDMKRWWDLVEKHDILAELPEEYNAEDVLRCAIKVLKKSYSMDYEVIDFNDMVAAPLVHKVPVRYQKDFIIIDEAQDTNDTRRLLALKFLKPDGRLVAVGDPNQAIFGFTGADADSLDIIKRQLNATTLPLNVTYRCPKAVVEEAKKIVPGFVAHESAPEGKVIRTTNVEVMKDLKAFRTDDVILCRNTSPLIDLAYTFIGNKIPVRVEGKEIGKGLKNLSNRWKVKTLDKLLDKLDLYVDRETKKWTEKKKEDVLEKILDKVQCLRTLVRMTMAEQKHTLADLHELIDTMFADTDSDKPQPMLTLSTIHKAKGREWKRVFLLGANRYMPSKYAVKDWQIGQENNLLYVGITRAMEELIYVDVV